MKVKLYEWATGDWSAVEIDGELYDERGSIPTFVWLEVLKQAGVDVVEITVQVDDETGMPASYGDWDEAPS